MRHQWTLALAMVVTGVAFGQKTESPETMLGKGLHLEEVEADCKEAIKVYQTLIEMKSAPPNLAARAQLHIGICQETLGRSEARTSYETVLSKYQDQGDIVRQARTGLASLRGGQDDSSRQPTAGALFMPKLVCRNCGGGNNGGASLTPNGTLAFINGQDGTLEVRDLSKGSKGEINRWVIGSFGRGGPLISPDGKQIAITTPFEGLRLIPNVPGSSPTQIQFQRIGGGTLIAWSPDGTSILSQEAVFGSGGIGGSRDVLGWRSIADGSLREVGDFGLFFGLFYDTGGAQRGARSGIIGGPSMLALSPDGQFIAYSPLVAADATQAPIYLVTASGSSKTALITDASLNRSPIWTADGKRVLFISDRTGTKDLWSIAIRDGKASGTPSLLFKDIGDIIPVRNGITREGTLFYTRTTGPSDRVFVVDMEAAGAKLRGPAPHTITSFEGREPTLSPNGKFAVYLKGRSPVIYSLDTGKERVLDYNRNILASEPAWLHDSSGFLEWRHDADAPRRGARGLELSADQVTAIQRDRNLDSVRPPIASLYRVDSGTGQATKLLQTDSRVSGIALSPDEKTVYSTGGSLSALENTIIAFDRSTGVRRNVYTAADGAIAWALSHDGRTLALLINGDNVKTIARVGIDGTGFQPLFTLAQTLSIPLTLTWTADDRSILFGTESGGNTRIMRVPVQGGPPEFTGLEGEQLRSLSLNADGSRLAYSGRTPATSEIWSLDLSSQLGK